MKYTNSSALVVVDVQNDFADPAGSLYVRGGEAIIPFINDQIERAATSGAFIVYTQDWHPAVTPHFEKDGGIWPVHCVGGSRGAELHPDLAFVEDALTIRKGVGGEDGYSGFNIRDPLTGSTTPTGLGSTLRERGVDVVAVLGLALDYCVKETALDAADEGFSAVVLADGTAAVNLVAGDGSRAVSSLVLGGVEIE